MPEPAIDLDAIADARTGKPGRLARYARRGVDLLPVLLILAGALFIQCAPDEISSQDFLEIAVLMAAALQSLRATLATAALSMVVQFWLEYDTGDVGSAASVAELVGQFTVCVAAVAINRLAAGQSRRLASARAIAAVTTQAALPTPPEEVGGLRLAASYRAADTEARIGGDLYAAQETPYGVRFVVGDVRGKGLQMVQTVSLVVGSFREIATHEPDLAAVADRLDGTVRRGVTAHHGLMSEETFVTAVFAEVATDTGTLRLVSRGHPSALLLTPNGGVDVLEPTTWSLPLGLGDLAPEADEVVEHPFPPGSTLLLVTDGVTEARDRRGVFYDPATALRGRTFTGPAELLREVRSDVVRHTRGHQEDDAAMLAVTRPNPDDRRAR
ncbi:PP2C family protein-serine/threonine phosphatase [Streptomyces sp. NBC_00483]|uniref:PP2C family protein-serine/threonine phosphatase n=1 Tax=Streptomyces sp. NBC_00483 TaxID=2975756 RepID=UPI002E199A77